MLDAIIRAATCLVTCDSEVSTGHLVADGVVLTTLHGVLGAIGSEACVTVRFAATARAAAAEFGATVAAHDEDLDACLLRLDGPCDRLAIPLVAEMPREGSRWLSFGYPKNKSVVG